MEGKTKISRYARISIVCGVIGLLTSFAYGGIVAIVGLVYGAFVLIDKLEGKQQALIGMALSAVAIMITAFAVHSACVHMRTGEYDEQFTQVYERLHEFQKQTRGITGGNEHAK